MSLPFELSKYHKTNTKYRWINQLELKETDEKIEEIYNKYIVATHCELCNKEFISRKDRHMEHCHESGRFRNIVCTRCNLLKHDNKLQSNNTSGYKGIFKTYGKTCKHGFYWKFEAYVNGKKKTIKSSVDFDKLVAFADKWKLENNYHT
tara:strand:+ start:49 stop:495 length:447 start_codon:yes stop_codon:yes gene_type:complete